MKESTIPILKRIIFCVVFILLFSLRSIVWSESSDYWPNQRWRISSPEEQGMSSEDLADMISLFMYAPISIDSVTVIRNGYIVLDAYFYPFQKDSAHVIHSCTKSITSTLIGIAIDKGYIKDVHHRLLDFFPELAPDNMTAAVGLDGVYRITELTEAKVAFKGRWFNENTFKFSYINVGHTQGPRGEFNFIENRADISLTGPYGGRLS